MPPPIDIKQSFLVKFFFNNVFIIKFTVFWFLFFSFDLKKIKHTFFPLRELIILLVILLGTLESINNRHFSNLIRF